VEERNRIILRKNYTADTNQDFFNVWLVINKCLSVYKHETISSLFNESENILKSTYENALKNDNLKYLSLRHKRVILRQKERLIAS
jgi:hypothetical protein